jgi:hypothetical protein
VLFAIAVVDTVADTASVQQPALLAAHPLDELGDLDALVVADPHRTDAVVLVTVLVLPVTGFALLPAAAGVAEEALVIPVEAEAGVVGPPPRVEGEVLESGALAELSWRSTPHGAWSPPSSGGRRRRACPA